MGMYGYQRAGRFGSVDIFLIPRSTDTPVCRDHPSNYENLLEPFSFSEVFRCTAQTYLRYTFGTAAIDTRLARLSVW